jgi:hypothetical protein
MSATYRRFKAKASCIWLFAPSSKELPPTDATVLIQTMERILTSCSPRRRGVPRKDFQFCWEISASLACYVGGYPIE